MRYLQRPGRRGLALSGCLSEQLDAEANGLARVSISSAVLGSGAVCWREFPSSGRVWGFWPAEALAVDAPLRCES